VRRDELIPLNVPGPAIASLAYVLDVGDEARVSAEFSCPSTHSAIQRPAVRPEVPELYTALSK